MTAAGKILTIGALNLRRLFRERINIFFVVIAPLLFTFVIGTLFGGGPQLRLGVVDGAPGPMSQRLVTALASGDDRVQVERMDTEDALRTAVERGVVQAGLVIPPGYDTDLRAGRQVVVRYLARPDDPAAAEAGIWVRSMVPQEATLLRAAQFGAATGAGSFEENLAVAGSVDLPGVEVAVTTTGESAFPEGFTAYGVVAPSLLLLFVFLTSMTAALGLIEARQRGITRRMFATPTSAGTIIAGEALGRFAVALTQGLIVVFGTALLFGVAWGDPLGAAALLVAFCLVGSGAAMLLGAVLRAEGAALGVALGLGIGLAAIGGVMIPLEQLSETMQRVARITPHAWGYDGFAELLRHGAGITGIAPQLGVLLGYAAVLFAAGAWRLRRALTG